MSWINDLYLKLAGGKNANAKELSEKELTGKRLLLSKFKELESLPDGMQVTNIDVSGCVKLKNLPARLSCFELLARQTAFETVPADLSVSFKADFTENAALRELPRDFKTGTLILNGCTALKKLPEGLDVRFLDISGCTLLTEWPQNAKLTLGRLNARGCTRLTTLPPWMNNLAQLDIGGCSELKELPETLRVSSWIDLANSGLKRLPSGCQNVNLRWRGVPIPERIAFKPESITVQEILAEKNAELRRVLLDRYGFSRFMQDSNAEILDIDRDKGGERRLMRVKMEGDEDLVCVSYFCPSTARQYLTRVPPATPTCRHGVAWIAGFDDPNDYRPLLET
jgi:hypothetical protein